jgi:hypothetical protein
MYDAVKGLQCPDQFDHFFYRRSHSGQKCARDNTVANTEFVDFVKAAKGLDAFIAQAASGLNTEIEFVSKFDGINNL